MSTKPATDLPAADLAARLRERAGEYEEAGREKLRAESALLAALANYERARYRERAAREEWDARLRAAGIQEPEAIAVSGSDDWHLGDASRRLRDVLQCGVTVEDGFMATGAMAVNCPACLAALDEVAS